MSDVPVSEVPVFSWLTKPRSEWQKPGDTTEGCSGRSYCTDFDDASEDQLDLSGTGMSELIFAYLADYLDCIEHPVAGSDDRRITLLDLKNDPRLPVFSLCAELAANANFVEYGVSLRTAWPTDAGRAWKASYSVHCSTVYPVPAPVTR